MRHVILNVTGRCDGAKQVCSCSKVIEITIPEGMHLHRAIEYVTEHAASEIARYAASEVLSQLAVVAHLRRTS